MVITCKNVANAVGAKTARACDSCIRKRARWYCAADDAFLCQGCDASVHSANQLARRHERVRLKTSSNKTIDEDSQENSVPSWHKGFTRKARTPRHGKAAFHQTSKGQDSMLRNGPFPLVPEIGFDDTSPDENDQDQLLYRVPIFDPFVAELCNSTTTSEAETAAATTVDVTNEGQISDDDGKTRESKVGYGNGVYNFHGFLPTDMDLAEFAADVESLLGRGLENESFDMEGLGLIDCKEKDSMECSLSSGRVVKLEEEEEEEEAVNNTDIDMTREPFELNFDYDSPVEEEEEEKVAAQPTAAGKISSGEYNEEDGDAKKKSIKKRNNIQLRLDYEGVITAWASQGSPWTTGSRPEFDPDNCWADCMGTCGTEVHHPYGKMSGMGGHTTMGDGGREARVSRYREKRRTRLFSKKIRYEVRKLNAEKRPRMKGRFVKRTSFAAPGFP